MKKTRKFFGMEMTLGKELAIGLTACAIIYGVVQHHKKRTIEMRQDKINEAVSLVDYQGNQNGRLDPEEAVRLYEAAGKEDQAIQLLNPTHLRYTDLETAIQNLQNQ